MRENEEERIDKRQKARRRVGAAILAIALLLMLLAPGRVSVPEPASLFLLGSSFVVLAKTVRRRRRPGETVTTFKDSL